MKSPISAKFKILITAVDVEGCCLSQDVWASCWPNLRLLLAKFEAHAVIFELTLKFFISFVDGKNTRMSNFWFATTFRICDLPTFRICDLPTRFSTGMHLHFPFLRSLSNSFFRICNWASIFIWSYDESLSRSLSKLPFFLFYFRRISSVSNFSLARKKEHKNEAQHNAKNITMETKTRY